MTLSSHLSQHHRNGIEDNTREALDEGWQAAGQNIKGFAEFLGKPIGAADDEATGFVRFSWQKLKDAWGTDPVGSLSVLPGLWGLRRGSSDLHEKSLWKISRQRLKQTLSIITSHSQLPPEVLTKALEDTWCQRERLQDTRRNGRDQGRRTTSR